MKIALVHDYIKEYGGAERVLETLHEIWPDAPVYTSVYLPKYLGPHKDRFKNWNIKTSFLQYIPFKEKLISPFRLIAPFVFKTFNMSSFDVVIVSATGAYSPNSIQCHPEQVFGSNSSGNEMPKRVRHDIGKGPIHVCYCHTPPRYLYGYATARNWNKSIILGSIGKIVNHFLRLVDFKSSKNVDYFIANSKNVKERIKKFYRRGSSIIYPPVNIQFQKTQSTQTVRKSDGQKVRRSDSLNIRLSQFSEYSGNYFLAGGRLARPKHIDLIIRACQELKMPLKIFGKAFAGYDNELRVDPSADGGKLKVEFLGEVTDEKKLELMRNARAYIFASEDEDFGITPVEAMSVGTPVIAYRSGGVVESVIDGKTGIFFNELTIESLIRAIKQFNGAGNITINPADCIKQAKKFSNIRFKRELKEFVESKIKK